MSMIHGVVLDPENTPVAGAAVYFQWGPVALPDIAARTGADGAFSMAAPAAGWYRLEANAAGFHPAEVDVEVPSTGEVRVEIKLRP